MSAAGKVTLSSIVSHSENQTFSDLGGEMVLLNINSGQYFGLDDVGSDVWRHLASPIEVAEMIRILVAEYVGDPGIIEQEVLVLLERLAEAGLIQVHS